MPTDLPELSFFNTAGAASYLAQIGISLSPRTLEAMRTKGAGPIFRKLGRGKRARVIYAEADLLAWLDAATRTSTADRGAA